ncbi:SET domain-containing protein [bacterium]|jgi:hypothetical protein|nr:SET domain-containing protein [bacterium]
MKTKDDSNKTIRDIPYLFPKDRTTGLSSDFVGTLTTLPPAYKSVDGGLYIANRKALESADPAIDGEEYDYFDTAVLEMNIAVRVTKEIQASAISNEGKTFLGLFTAALFQEKMEEAVKLLTQLSDQSPDQITEITHHKSYRALQIRHLVVLFCRGDIERAILWEILNTLNCPDTVDNLGATALMRAEQLALTLPNHPVQENARFHPVDLYAGGKCHRLDSKQALMKSLETHYGRTDILSDTTICERDVLLYLLVFLPKAFHAAQFNKKQIELFNEKYDANLALGDTLPSIAIANHDHSTFGTGQLGLFAQESIEKGQIVRFLCSSIKFGIKEDLNPMEQNQEYLFKSKRSDYAFYFLPLQDLIVNYKNQSMLPWINIMPEQAADPIMFLNDSGTKDGNNMTWIHFFIDGLPVGVFVSTKAIPKGYELLTGYIVESDTWAQLRDMEIMDIPIEPHPMIVGTP